MPITIATDFPTLLDHKSAPLDPTGRLTPDWYSQFSGTRTWADAIEAGLATAATTAEVTAAIAAASAAFSAQIFLNKTKVNKTAGYTVVSGDDGKAILLAGSGYYALTFGAAGGYPDDHSNLVFNADTVRAKNVIVTGGTDFKLYPNQWGLVFKDGSGAWKTGLINRASVFSPTFYCNAQGSDTANDGLSTGTSNAFLTPQKAIDTALFDIDSRGTVPVINLADNAALGSGFEYQPFQVVSDGVGSNQVQVIGNATAPQNVIVARSSAGILCYAKDKGILTVEHLTLQPLVANCSSIVAEHLGVCDFQGIIFLAAATHITSNDTGSNVNCIGDYYIQGGATAHMVATSGGNILAGGPANTITITTTPAFTYFALATSRGGIKTNGAITYTGAVNAATQKYLSNTQGGIIMNGTVFPGGVAGVADAATYGLAL